MLEKIDRDEITLVWETRGPLWEETEARENLKTVLRRLDIPHVMDPFRIVPVHARPVAYFRLHGLGERMYYYQYMNGGLQELADVARSFAGGNRNAYVLLNNLSMFEDAKRFLSYIEKARFPPLAEAKGHEHLRALLSKTKFPASKRTLAKRLGRRLVELEDGKQVRLIDALKYLPSKTYEKPEEVKRSEALKAKACRIGPYRRSPVYQ